jgi:hypothetical protein
MQHLVNGFDAVCRRHRHDGKGDRRLASCFIPLGTRAAANNFFCCEICHRNQLKITQQRFARSSFRRTTFV